MKSSSLNFGFHVTCFLFGWTSAMVKDYTWACVQYAHGSIIKASKTLHF